MTLAPVTVRYRLEKLRPDVLKIDKSYTGAIGIDGVNATVTDMIIATAHRLKIVTIAEGVETQEQKIYMRSHGVDLLQGILLCPPVAGGGFSALAGGREAPSGGDWGKTTRRASLARRVRHYSSSSLSWTVLMTRTRSTR